jgi:hypothetical protein
MYPKVLEVMGVKFRTPVYSLFSLFLFVQLSGCSSNVPGLGTLHPVKGEVLFQGKPTPGAIVEFTPESEAGNKSRQTSRDATRVVGTVNSEGEFSVISYVPEGAKPGAETDSYLITISWTKPTNPNDKDSDLGPELLPPRYQDPIKSGLKFEVQPGSNVIPTFELKP